MLLIYSIILNAVEGVQLLHYTHGAKEEKYGKESCKSL